MWYLKIEIVHVCETASWILESFFNTYIDTEDKLVLMFCGSCRELTLWHDWYKNLLKQEQMAIS